MAKRTTNTAANKTTADIIIGSGEMAQRIREYDWKSTGLGHITEWPPSLVTSVNLVIQSPTPIVMLWGNDGRMIYNDAYSVFAGQRHPQLLGSKVLEGWPEVADFNENVMEQCLRKGKTLSYNDQQLTLYRNNVGEKVWMDLNYSPIIGEAGTPVGVFAIVVETAQRILAEQRQRQAEAALQAEQERLKVLLQQTPAIIAVLQGPDHVFKMANPVCMHVIAGDRNIIDKPLLEVLPEFAGQEQLVQLLDIVRETGKPYVGQQPAKIMRHGKGKPEAAYFNLVLQPIKDPRSGKKDSVFVHAVEVTEQLNNIRKLEELNAQLEAIFESMPDGVYIAEKGQIIRINQRGAEALGFNNPNDVPRELDKLYESLSFRDPHNDTAFTIQDSTLGNALAGKNVQLIAEVDNPITGETRVIRTASAPIKNKEGEVIGAIAINTDLTEQYRMQQKVQKEVLRRRFTQKTKLLREQNQELTKLNATKNEFIALTSHQLRTPATGVKQYIAMLMQGYAGPLTAEQEQYLELAYESNERQLHIIEDILRVAKVDMGKTQIQKEPRNIIALIENILGEQADHFAESKLRLVRELPTSPVMAHIDSAQLHMAIGNIVDNAIKYTPEGRQITVTVRNVEGETVELEIADEGVGIAKEDVDKLFQKFSRIPNSRSILVGGTGLGLYWTKRIIQLHGGTITVESEIDKGTRFVIRLPQP